MSFQSLFAPVDMTQGNPVRQIMVFSVPMLLGNIAQQLYNTGQVQQAEQVLNKAIDEGIGKPYWLARAFVLLSDIYRAEGRTVEAKQTLESLKANYKEDLVEYASIKFRPGSGNDGDGTIGAACSYPLMRVEEMFFIQAEAVAQQGRVDDAKTLLTDFMATRNPNYSCTLTEKDAVIEEIVFQKRVELWGEGQTFFDIKRLNMSVTRGYEGSNFYELCRFNTNGRPAWMNFVIVRTEENNNSAVTGMNNPDPSDYYTPIKED